MRHYVLNKAPGEMCDGSIRMLRTHGPYTTRQAYNEGDYGALARGYGWFVLHCPHCHTDHAGMTCHRPPKEV